MSDIQDTNIHPKNFYYESEFASPSYSLISQYALDITIENNFANMLFYGDLSRIIYASNDYCFKRRTEFSNEGLLNLPFMNYYCTGISPDTDRFLWKNSTNVQPMLNLDNYATDLGFGLKIVPVHLNYEANIWYSQDKDLQYAASKIIFQDTNETILYGLINAGKDYAGVDNILRNPAFMKYNLDFKPQYTESEWLESNNITSMALDFEFDTFMLYPDVPNVLVTPQGTPNQLYIAEEVIVNFLYTKGNLLKNSELFNTSPQNLITQYFYTGD